MYYYNEHGQVEIVVITLKEFFKLTFLSFGIPNANRWDVEFSLSNSLKVLRNACQSEIRLNLKQCLRFLLFHHKHETLRIGGFIDYICAVLQLQTFFAHIQIFIKYKTYSQSCFFSPQNVCWSVGSIFFHVMAPHCSSSDTVNPAAPPSTSPVPLVIGLVGGITLILFLSLLLLCGYMNLKIESYCCLFHLNQSYSKLFGFESRTYWCHIQILWCSHLKPCTHTQLYPAWAQMFCSWIQGCVFKPDVFQAHTTYSSWTWGAEFDKKCMIDFGSPLTSNI